MLLIFGALTESQNTFAFGRSFRRRAIVVVRMQVRDKCKVKKFGTKYDRHARMTTHGVETQIYRKQAGKWRLVHVHYSEDRAVGP
jgi:hypothetical protein